MKIFEPITFEEANEHSRWQDAMSQEMESVTDNKTWTFIDLPSGKKEISSKWMQLKSKLGLEGQGNKLKARLVALGFELEYGIDHGEAFALQSSETLLETW